MSSGIPGPQGSSLARLSAFHRDPLRLFRTLTEEWGPRVRFRMGPWYFVLLAEPEAAGWVLSHHAQGFVKGPGLDNKNPLIGRGLLPEEGPRWANQRRRMAPIFKPANVTMMRPWLDETVTAWCQRQVSGETLDLQASMLELSLAMALQTLFADDNPSVEFLEDIGRHVTWIMEHFYRRTRSVWRFPYHIPGFNRRYHSHARRLASAVRSLKPRPRPFRVVWDALAPEPDSRLDEMLTLIIAGFETTGHAVSWALDELGRHPLWQEQVYQESLQESWPSPATHPSTEAVLKESLRLYPPVWLLSRKPTEALTHQDLALKPDDFVLISPWLLHRQPAIFAAADEFRPERWLENPPQPPYAFIPFGGGPRRCIGEHLAMAEGMLAISRIIQQFHVESHGARELYPGLTLSSLKPMRARLTRRP